MSLREHRESKSPEMVGAPVTRFEENTGFGQDKVFLAGKKNGCKISSRRILLLQL
jgi:hypothetical protein